MSRRRRIPRESARTRARPARRVSPRGARVRRIEACRAPAEASVGTRARGVLGPLEPPVAVDAHEAVDAEAVFSPLGEYLVAEESRHPHIRLAAVEVGGDGHGEVPSEVVVREGVSPLAVGGGARAIGVQEEHGAPLGIELEEPNPPSAARVGLPRDDDARDRETTRGALRADRSVPRRRFGARRCRREGSARGDVVARARGAGERARAVPRVRVTRRVERHRVSVRDDSSQPRERNDAAPSPRANRSTRDAARSSLDSRAQGCERSRGRSTRNARAHDAAKPRGWVAMCHPRDGREETHAQRTIPNRWLGAFASGTARVSPTVACPARGKLAWSPCGCHAPC